MERLTIARVRIAQPRDKLYDIRDTEAKGLVLRIGVSGAKSYSWRGTVKGGEKLTLTLGDADVMTLAEAREKALAARILARQGIDPRQERKAQIAALAPVSQRLMRDLVEPYLDAYVVRGTPTSRGEGPVSKSSLRAETRAADVVAELIGNRPVADLTNDDAIALRDEVSKQGPATAVQVFGAARRLVEFARERGHCDRNPFRDLRAPRPAKARSRYLNPNEFRKVYDATSQLDPNIRDLYRLLMTTPLRFSNAANLRWDQIDDDLIRLDKTKSTGAWVVPMPQTAVDMLANRSQRVDLVFPSPGKSGRNVDGVFNSRGKVKAKLDEVSGVTGWRLHDMRRTILTLTGDVSEHYDRSAGELWLQHRPPGIVGIYQVSSAVPAMRRMAGEWDIVLRSILGD